MARIRAHSTFCVGTRGKLGVNRRSTRRLSGTRPGARGGALDCSLCFVSVLSLWANAQPRLKLNREVVVKRMLTCSVAGGAPPPVCCDPKIVFVT
eukprot:1841391-Prymnesium_polylepis.1